LPNLTPNSLQIPSQTLQSITNINVSATSSPIHVQTSNPPRQNTLKHAIEAKITSQHLLQK